MKAIVICLLVILAVSIRAEDQGPATDIAFFVNGLLRGALDKDIGKVDKCLTNGDVLIADIDRIIHYLQSGFDIYGAIRYIGKLVVDLPVSLQNCGEIKEVVSSTLSLWISYFKSPVTLAKILYVALDKYPSRITKDADSFVADWKSGKYESSGLNLGDLLNVLFNLCPAQIAPEVWRSIKVIEGSESN